MTEAEKTELEKSIEELSTKVDDASVRLKNIEAVRAPLDFQQNIRTRFQENGNWARHYSTVRMTITTFLIPVSLGILGFKWNPSARPDITFIALSGVVWSSAVILFLVFTRLTFCEMERARLKRNELPGSAAENRSASAFHPRKDAASWILICVSICYAVVLICLSNVRLWPPNLAAGALWHLRPLAYAIPGAAFVTAIVAFFVTLLQPECDSRSS
jgi:hypothetical protein